MLGLIVPNFGLKNSLIEWLSFELTLRVGFTGTEKVGFTVTLTYWIGRN